MCSETVGTGVQEERKLKWQKMKIGTWEKGRRWRLLFSLQRNLDLVLHTKNCKKRFTVTTSANDEPVPGLVQAPDSRKLHPIIRAYRICSFSLRKCQFAITSVATVSAWSSELQRLVEDPNNLRDCLGNDNPNTILLLLVDPLYCMKTCSRLNKYYVLNNLSFSNWDTQLHGSMEYLPGVAIFLKIMWQK